MTPNWKEKGLAVNQVSIPHFVITELPISLIHAQFVQNTRVSCADVQITWRGSWKGGWTCTLYQGGEDRDDDTWWKVSRLCRCVKHIFLSLSSLCHRRYTLSSVVSIYLVAGCLHVHRIARCTITQRKVFKNWKHKSFIPATPMSVRFQMLCQWFIFVEWSFQPIAKTEGDNWLVDEWTLRTMFLLARDHSFSHFTPVVWNCHLCGHWHTTFDWPVSGQAKIRIPHRAMRLFIAINEHPPSFHTHNIF